MRDEPQKGEVVLYQTEDGKVKLNVRLQDETVWLTQQLIAELFQTTIPNISMHIRNIYEEGELTPEATIKKFLTVRREGRRDVRRELDFYNLDMIISVGYRVKSLIATRFRIWATQRLKEWKGQPKNISKRVTRRGIVYHFDYIHYLTAVLSFALYSPLHSTRHLPDYRAF
jgi:hypothetical protein